VSHATPALLRSLAEGELSEAEAAPLRRHLRSCASCRARLVERRPEALFTLLGGERPAPVDWESFGRRLRASLEAEGKLAAFPSRRWVRAASLAAAALLLAFLALLPLGLGDAPGTGPVADLAGAPPVLPADQEPLPEDLVRILDEALRRHRALDPLGDPPTVELVESSTAQVYDLGTSGSGMQVVLIVDEELDL
jgi:hypothetical protein